MIPSRRFSERATETRRRLRHHENRPRPARVFLPTRDGSVGVVAGAMKSADRLSAKGFSERSTFENTAKSGNNPGKKCCRTPPPGTLEGTATRHLLRVQCPTARSPSASAWCTRPSWPSRRSATTVRPDPVVVSFTGLAPASSARSRMGPGGPRVRPEDSTDRATPARPGSSILARRGVIGALPGRIAGRPGAHARPHHRVARLETAWILLFFLPHRRKNRTTRSAFPTPGGRETPPVERATDQLFPATPSPQRWSSP